MFLFTCFQMAMLNACKQRTVSVKTNINSTINLVDFKRPNAKGSVYGKTPKNIPISKLKGKFIRLTSKGHEPQNWVFTDLISRKIRLSTKLAKVDDKSDKNKDGSRQEPEEDARLESQRKAQEIKSNNRLARMIMRSYVAFTNKKYRDSFELANQLGALYPNLAAPLIIKGLIFLKQNKKKIARISFLKAKNLDPEDKDIDQLIQLSKP